MIVATISANNYQHDKERLDEYCVKDKVEIKIFKPKETVKSKRLRLIGQHNSNLLLK